MLGGQKLQENIHILPTNEGETYDPVVRELNEYLQQKRNISSLTYELFNMWTKYGEQKKHWMERRRVITDHCELENFTVKVAL